MKNTTFSAAEFSKLVKTRRATRTFDARPVEPELIYEALQDAHWAPSGFNLQPVHFFIVHAPAENESLQQAVLHQKQVKEASYLIVFAGNRRVHKEHVNIALECDLACGAITEKYAERCKKLVHFSFDDRPFGIRKWTKRLFTPLLRLFSPSQDLPAANIDLWLSKHVGLAAMAFMLSAESRGLSTSPMEGFDPVRLRKALSIPRHFYIPLIVAVGYHSAPKGKKGRIPMDQVCHWI